jgi:hypothetical protein
MITRKHKEFKAISGAISLLYTYKEDLQLPKLWFKHIISSLISAVTELSEDSEGKVLRRKILGQPFWSKKAIQKVRENINEGERHEKGLQHEHVIPKTYYFDKFEKLERPSQRNIQRLLETTVAAIVTEEEHKQLPDAFKGNKIWERYKERSIIFDLSDFKTKKEQLELFKSKYFQFKKLRKINLSK